MMVGMPMVMMTTIIMPAPENKNQKRKEFQSFWPIQLPDPPLHLKTCIQKGFNVNMLMMSVCGPEDALGSKNTSPWHLPVSICLPKGTSQKNKQNK